MSTENQNNQQKESSSRTSGTRDDKSLLRANLFSWSASESELRERVDSYEDIKFFRSYRGRAITLTSAFLLFLLYTGFVTDPELFSGVAYVALACLPILHFIHKGYRWAILLTIGLYVFIAVMALLNAQGMIAVFWAIVTLPSLYKAWKVENRRLAS